MACSLSLQIRLGVVVRELSLQNYLPMHMIAIMAYIVGDIRRLRILHVVGTVLGVWPPRSGSQSSRQMELYKWYCFALILFYVFVLWRIVIMDFDTFIVKRFTRATNRILALLSMGFYKAVVTTFIGRSCCLARRVNRMTKLFIGIDNRITGHNEEGAVVFYTDIALSIPLLVFFLTECILRIGRIDGKKENLAEVTQFAALYFAMLIVCQYAIAIRRRFERFNLVLSECQGKSPATAKRLRGTYNRLTEVVHLYNEVFGTHLFMFVCLLFVAAMQLTNLVIMRFYKGGVSKSLILRTIVMISIIAVSTILLNTLR